jgi:hypothetical protein
MGLSFTDAAGPRQHIAVLLNTRLRSHEITTNRSLYELLPRFELGTDAVKHRVLGFKTVFEGLFLSLGVITVFGSEPFVLASAV